MNVNNNIQNYDKLRYLQANHGSWGGAMLYAVHHHKPTQETWTEEEFQATSRKFFNMRNTHTEVDDAYLELLVNFRHEETRRSLMNTMKHNEFSAIANRFGRSSWRTDDVRISTETNVFHTLGRVLEQQKAGVEQFRETFGGRFLSEEQLDNRLFTLYHQFNQAINEIAQVFLLHSPDSERTVLRIGDMVRDFIWSGGSSDDITTMLQNSELSSEFEQLIRANNRWRAATL